MCFAVNGQMQLLQALHRQGHTVIIITHDLQIARYARRIIQLSDGKIQSDHSRTVQAVSDPENITGRTAPLSCSRHPSWQTRWERGLDVLWNAWRILFAHRLRTSLTLLGIVIGIASVVLLNAAGEGARRYVLNSIATMGGNVVTLYPGKGPGDDFASGLRSLRAQDLSLLTEQKWILAATPKVSGNLRIRWQQADTSASINGVSTDFLKIDNLALTAGRSLLPFDIQRQSSVVVIDDNVRKKLFATTTDPLGQIILVGSLPCRVVGVVRSQSAYAVNALNLWLPWSTANSRLLGQDWFDSISVYLDNRVSAAAAGRAIQTMLIRLHGRQDFYMQDSDAFVTSFNQISFAMTLFLSLVALISLLVGGIGVMNIMLVSVAERTRETGIRMAVGARQRDIQCQFLTEAILICLLGAVLGVIVSVGMGGCVLCSSLDGRWCSHSGPS
jgi:macrolide transport system ATP-binding/permease protein